MGQQHTTRATAKKLAEAQTRNTQRSRTPMPRPLPRPGATPQYPPVEGRHRRPRRPLARGSMRPTRDRRRSRCRRRRPFTFQSPGPQPPLPQGQDHQGAAGAGRAHGRHATSHARAAPMPGHSTTHKRDANHLKQSKQTNEATQRNLHETFETKTAKTQRKTRGPDSPTPPRRTGGDSNAAVGCSASHVFGVTAATRAAVLP